MRRSRQAAPGSMSQRARGRSRATQQVGSAIFLCIVMVLSGLLLYLWPQMRLVDLEYRQAALLKQRRQAIQAQKDLQVELATLRQLSRIERIALRRLKMRPPTMAQTIYLPSQLHRDARRR